MVTHGHGDAAYGHYAINLWPKDLNFTISSMARCFHTLGKPSIRNSKRMIDEPPLDDYFEIDKLWGKPL